MRLLRRAYLTAAPTGRTRYSARGSLLRLAFSDLTDPGMFLRSLRPRTVGYFRLACRFLSERELHAFLLGTDANLLLWQVRIPHILPGQGYSVVTV